MGNMPKQIKAWTWNNHAYSGQWHVNSRAETTDYTRKDIADAAYLEGIKAGLEAAAKYCEEDGSKKVVREDRVYVAHRIQDARKIRALDPHAIASAVERAKGGE